jgi:hypothetical protein
MDKEMIEKLKNNEKPFGLLNKEEQGCLREVKEVEVYDGGWFPMFKTCRFEQMTYRLPASYQEEASEYEVFPITMANGIYKYQPDDYCLFWALSDSRFAGVQYENQEGDAWYMHVIAFIDDRGRILSNAWPADMEAKVKVNIATPIKIRLKR